MRSAVMVAWLVASLAAGCSQPAPEPAVLHREDWVVPAGQNAFIDVSLDEGESVHWEWTSSRLTQFYGELHCPGEGPSTRGQGDVQGSGSFTGTAHGCIVGLLWLDLPEPYDLHVVLTGSGMVVKTGFE